MSLTATRQPDGKWTVANGKVKAADINDSNFRSVNNAALLLKSGGVVGCTRDDVMAAIQAAEASELPDGDGAGGPAFEVFADSSVVSEDDPIKALRTAYSTGARFLRWSGDMTAMDIDTSRRYPLTWIRDLADRSGASLAWLSRSGGGRLIFRTGGHAAAAALLLDIHLDPDVDKIELLKNTRSPASEVIDLAATKADEGGVGWLVATTRGDDISTADEELVAGWLTERGMRMHERHDHTFCEFDPRPASGNDPVVPLEGGLYCFVCAKFKRWAHLIGVAQSEHPLLVAAENRTHWAHQQIVMRARWDKKLPWKAARDGYEALVSHYVSGDQDVLAAVFNPDWIWFRSESGAWINPDAQPTEAATEGVRDCLDVLSWTKGKKERRVRAANPNRLPGVTPIRPCGVILRPDVAPDGVIMWQKRDDVKPWRDDVKPWAEAFAELLSEYPGCDETYLKLCLVGMVCAEGGHGQFQILATGQSGTAKSSIPRVAAGIVGSVCASLRVESNGEDWRRQVGQALENGHRPIVANEVDKIRGLRKHVAKFLDLSDPLQWRPLYGVDIRSSWRVPFICTAINKPDLFNDPEFGRRFRHVDLLSKVPSPWYGKDFEGFRLALDERETSVGIKRGEGWRALCADSLLRWALEFAAGHGFDWDACADALHVPRSDASDEDERQIVADTYGALFDYVCGPGAKPSASSRWPARHGWIDLTDPRAVEILDAVRPDVSDDSANWVLATKLKSVDWTGIVGRPCKMEVKCRGNDLVGRFRAPSPAPGGTLRQNWLTNSEIVA